MIRKNDMSCYDNIEKVYNNYIGKHTFENNLNDFFSFFTTLLVNTSDKPLTEPEHNQALNDCFQSYFKDAEWFKNFHIYKINNKDEYDKKEEYELFNYKKDHGLEFDFLLRIKYTPDAQTVLDYMKVEKKIYNSNHVDTYIGFEYNNTISYFDFYLKKDSYYSCDFKHIAQVFQNKIVFHEKSDTTKRTLQMAQLADMLSIIAKHNENILPAIIECMFNHSTLKISKETQECISLEKDIVIADMDTEVLNCNKNKDKKNSSIINI